MPAVSPEQDYQQVQIERQRLEEGRRRLQQDIDARLESIATLRGELEGKVVDFQRECEELSRVLRRASYEDVVRYRVYQGAQVRMAGVLSQVLKRASVADRVLDVAHAEQEERALRERQEESREKVRAMRRNVANLQLPKDDDFESLYEGVIDAS